MTSPNLSDLIERVEAATGPDREIDALIAVAASKEPTARVAYMAGRRWYKKPGAGRIPFAGAFGSGAALGMIFQDRRYTASLDAAMALVPKGWIVEILRYFNSDGEYVAAVTLTDSFTVGRGFEPAEKVSVSAQIVERRQGIDPTPQAIVLASLRALQEKDHPHA